MIMAIPCPDLDARDAWGHTPLTAAIIARLGMIDRFAKARFMIAYILLVKGADPNATGQFGKRPLHSAAFWNDLEIIKLLIQHGADINAKDNDSNTPLAVAHRQANLNVVRALLDLGAR